MRDWAHTVSHYDLWYYPILDNGACISTDRNEEGWEGL